MNRQIWQRLLQSNTKTLFQVIKRRNNPCIEMLLLWISLVTVVEALVQPCVDDVMACNRPVHFNMTFSEACRNIQEELVCLRGLDQDENCPDKADSLYAEGLLTEAANNADFFGCYISFASLNIAHRYQADEEDCNFMTLLSCYDDVFGAFGKLGLKPITVDTSMRLLKENIDSLISDFGDNPTTFVVGREQFCHGMTDAMFDGYLTCITDEKIKCGSVFREEVDTGMNNITSLVERVHNLTKLMRGFCASSCDYILQQGYAVMLCKPLDDRFQNVLTDYAAGTSTEESCIELNGAAQCIKRNGGQCQVILDIYLMPLAKPENYQMFVHCGFTPSEYLETDPESCAFAYELEFNVYKANSCYDTLLPLSYAPNSLVPPEAYQSDEALCSALQDEITCMAQNIHCCSVKETETSVMLHSFATMNTLISSCDIKLTSDNQRFAPIRPTGAECNYTDVIGCLADVFQALNVDLPTADQINATHLWDIQFKLDMVGFRHSEFCNTPFEMDVVRTCIRDVYAKCEMLEVCTYDASQPIHIGDTKTLLINLNQLENFKKGCNDVKCQLGTVLAIEQCAIEHKKFDYHVQKLKFQEVLGLDLTCSGIRALGDCYESALKDCPAYTDRIIHNTLHIDRPEVHQVISGCLSSFGGVDVKTDSHEVSIGMTAAYMPMLVVVSLLINMASQLF